MIMDPNWIKVQSTNIDRIKYHEEVQELYVEFRSGKALYRYSGVPKEVFLDLKEAESVGSYLSLNIKGKYPTTKFY